SGATPSSGKNSDDTICVFTRRGSPAPVSVNAHGCQAANRRNVRLSRCQSSQLAGETSARELRPPVDSSTITSCSPSRDGRRQRPQQELIDDGKDGGVAADAEGQRQDHGERKARAAPETTSPVSDISRDIFYKAHRALVVAALLEQCQIAELPPGGPLRVDVA